MPGDVAVIGFDGIEKGDFHVLALSTVRTDRAEIARLALAFLARRIAGGADASPQEGYASFELLVRGSTDETR